ncbi:MAG: DNA polymerase III subunit delta [Rubrivivax sp.]
MLVRAEQLPALGARGGHTPGVVLLGDAPLQMTDAGSLFRAAARAAGCTEREVFNVSGAHFDWSAVVGAAQSMGLFGDGKLLELRMPGGKPGKEGADALQRLAQWLSEPGSTGLVLMVLLPKLDSSGLKSAWLTALDAAGLQVRMEPVGRAALPAWIAQRLARQGQSVPEGAEGERALAFFADRVEGNLLAAHQEVQKLALLHPPGELSAEAIESAVLDVARYDIRQFCAAVLDGQVSRALRMLQGLQDEGETAVGVHWQLAQDLRDMAAVRQALDAGKPLPMALADARLWGPRQTLIERAVPRFSAAALQRLLMAAAVCDGVAKGLKRPDWPAEPWEALRRLALMALHFSRPAAAPRTAAAPGARRLPLALPASPQ